MHPSIRIICFFCFGAYVAFGSEVDLLLAVILLTVGYLIVGIQHLRAVLIMLKRMRWLFISIFAIYTWFTPGKPLFSDWIEYAPTFEGVVTGLLRALSLTAIVLAVGVLIRTLTREQLLSGILWLLRPVAALGLPYERLAVRLALTLEYVHQVQDIYSGAIGADNSSQTTTLRQRLSQISQRACLIFENVLQKAQQSAQSEILLVSSGRPPFWQWLYPLLLIGGFQLIHIS
jgi:energy-coupling factor transport system permease protein